MKYSREELPDLIASKTVREDAGWRYAGDIPYDGYPVSDANQELTNFKLNISSHIDAAQAQIEYLTNIIADAVHWAQSHDVAIPDIMPTLFK